MSCSIRGTQDNLQKVSTGSQGSCGGVHSMRNSIISTTCSLVYVYAWRHGDTSLRTHWGAAASPGEQTSANLVEGLLRDGCSSVGLLQRLFDLLGLHGQVSFKVPAAEHHHEGRRSSVLPYTDVYDLTPSAHQTEGRQTSVPAQSHAGVFGRLSAGEHLVVTHDGHVVFWIEDLQSADLGKEEEEVT